MKLSPEMRSTLRAELRASWLNSIRLYTSAEELGSRIETKRTSENVPRGLEPFELVARAFVKRLLRVALEWWSRTVRALLPEPKESFYARLERAARAGGFPFVKRAVWISEFGPLKRYAEAYLRRDPDLGARFATSRRPRVFGFAWYVLPGELGFDGKVMLARPQDLIAFVDVDRSDFNGTTIGAPCAFIADRPKQSLLFTV